MAPKEPTRQQISSRLAYSQDTPAFLQRLKNRVTGTVNDDEEEDFDEWQAASGRPPIPRRPSPPQRPDDDPGSADEDEGDEKPQVVVLREGKHMTEREAENERRRARGLPPIPGDSKDEDEEHEADQGAGKGSNKQKPEGKDAKAAPSLSFSSSGVASGPRAASKKRKVVGDDLSDLVDKEKTQKKGKKAPKAKKAKTGALLSFGEDDG